MLVEATMSRVMTLIWKKKITYVCVCVCCLQGIWVRGPGVCVLWDSLRLDWYGDVSPPLPLPEGRISREQEERQRSSNLPVINVGRRARSELHHRVTPDPTHPPSHVRARAPHGPSGVEDACVWMHARRRRGESTGQVKAAGKLRVNSSSGGFTLARCSPAAPRVCQQPLPFNLFTAPPPSTDPVVYVRACVQVAAVRLQRGFWQL